MLAVPSQTLRHNLTAWRPLLPPGATLVSLAKGVELGTLERMSEVIAEVADVPSDHVAVLSGPNLAREIAVGRADRHGDRLPRPRPGRRACSTPA